MRQISDIELFMGFGSGCQYQAPTSQKLFDDGSKTSQFFRMKTGSFKVLVTVLFMLWRFLAVGVLIVNNWNGVHQQLLAVIRRSTSTPLLRILHYLTNKMIFELIHQFLSLWVKFLAISCKVYQDIMKLMDTCLLLDGEQESQKLSRELNEKKKKPTWCLRNVVDML